MLMIWSSRPRNRSLDPVVSCFFGRMLPSAAATESQLPIRGNPRNEIASFRGFEPQKLAFSNRRIGGKQTLAQGLTSCSRPTKPALVRENDRTGHQGSPDLDQASRDPLDGRHAGRHRFMLPWSFSEEAATEKHMAQVHHNMWVANCRGAVLSIITKGGKWVEFTHR